MRLGLGWAAVIIALGTGLYGYYVDFEQAKPLVWAGVSLCVLLIIVLLRSTNNARAQLCYSDHVANLVRILRRA